MASGANSDGSKENKKRVSSDVDESVSNKRPRQEPEHLPNSIGDAIRMLISNLNKPIKSYEDEYDCNEKPLIFAISSSLESFPVQPLVHIDGCGVLPLPLTEMLFKELSRQFSSHTISNSICIDAGKLSFGESSFEEMVNKLRRKRVFPKIGCFAFLRQGCQLTKLMIEGPCSSPKMIQQLQSDEDTLQYINKDMYKCGTLCIQLPSTYSGGEIAIEHVQNCSLSCAPSSNTQACYYYSFIGPVTVLQAPITSGYKVTLEYTLYAPGGISSSLHPTVTRKLAIGRCLQYLADRDKPAFWPLIGSCKGKVNSLWKFTRKKDEIAMDSLLEGALYANCKGMEFYLGSLIKHSVKNGRCLNPGAHMWDERPSWEPKEQWKKTCFESTDDSTDVSYTVSEYKPLTPATPAADNFDWKVNIKYINKFSNIIKWEPTIEVGCSGYTPKHPRRVTFESQQKNDVIVILPQSTSFNLKLEHSIESAIEHLDGIDAAVADEDKLREMEKAVIVKLRNKLSRSSCGIKYKMFSICLKHKTWLSCLDMLRMFARKNNAGIPIKEDVKFAYKMIAEVVTTFGWGVTKVPIMQLFIKCQTYQCKEVIKCAKLIPEVDKTEVFKILINKITVESDHDMNFKWFFRHIFQYGVLLPTIPESIWDTLGDCYDFTTFRNLNNCLKRYGDQVGDKILEIYFNQLDRDTWLDSFEDRYLNSVLGYCVKFSKSECLSKFVELAIETFPPEEKCCPVTAFIMEAFGDSSEDGYDVADIPQPLLTLLQQRHDTLKGIFDKGAPPFTWAQPNVTSVGKQADVRMIEFFHSPVRECKMKYEDPFKVTEFVERVNRGTQYTESGFYNVELEGNIMKLIKKDTAWKQDIERYKNNVKEYQRITAYIEKEGITLC